MMNPEQNQPQNNDPGVSPQQPAQAYVPETPAAPETPVTPAAPAAAPAAEPAFAGSPTPQAPLTSYPGKGLGIASLVVSIVGAGLVGIVLGIVGLRQSKKAGRSNGFAIAGIIVGIVNIIAVSAIIALIVSAANAVKDNTTCTPMTEADGTVMQHCTFNGDTSAPQ